MYSSQRSETGAPCRRAARCRPSRLWFDFYNERRPHSSLEHEVESLEARLRRKDSVIAEISEEFVAMDAQGRSTIKGGGVFTAGFTYGASEGFEGLWSFREKFLKRAPILGRKLVLSKAGNSAGLLLPAQDWRSPCPQPTHLPAPGLPALGRTPMALTPMS